MTEVSCKIKRVSLSALTIALLVTFRLRRWADILSRSLGESTLFVKFAGDCGELGGGVEVVGGVGVGVVGLAPLGSEFFGGGTGIGTGDSPGVGVGDPVGVGLVKLGVIALWAII
jgi:hypothetical protein